ncbi:MAG: cob(I)yrinic acid a,c-diamide adenosyltransferase [Chloroflexi bacterium]|nr:cob(I)yrinic acid a,c-diamide adenosyltransferase [Chloroflexota bacterium]MCH8283802.1 cob(I)yrinic acid a,c-diamide adenosyltransferase [Chloroflexota bacterium]MCI0769500.1 cob(I)yrinic acid a,c-diamide adenosyltransferase [Chloroflexota bacterium]
MSTAAKRSIVTKTGDTGETGLLYGGRVPKDDPRVEAYGTIDEAVAVMGLARSLSSFQRVKETLLETQKQLFSVAAELAIDVAEYDKFDAHFSRVTPEMVDGLETRIAAIEAEVAMPPTFIVPGASPASGALDMARTVVRRAERRVAALKAAGLVRNGEILRYLNRLSDLVYTLARYENKDTDPEILAGGRA